MKEKSSSYISRGGGIWAGLCSGRPISRKAIYSIFIGMTGITILLALNNSLFITCPYYKRPNAYCGYLYPLFTYLLAYLPFRMIFQVIWPVLGFPTFCYLLWKTSSNGNKAKSAALLAFIALSNWAIWVFVYFFVHVIIEH